MVEIERVFYCFAVLGWDVADSASEGFEEVHAGFVVDGDCVEAHDG